MKAKSKDRKNAHARDRLPNETTPERPMRLLVSLAGVLVRGASISSTVRRPYAVAILTRIGLVIVSSSVADSAHSFQTEASAVRTVCSLATLVAIGNRPGTNLGAVVAEQVDDRKDADKCNDFFEEYGDELKLRVDGLGQKEQHHHQEEMQGMGLHGCSVK